jgi:phospholipid/cholesterol/gamma-HCH transport system permease protein
VIAVLSLTGRLVLDFVRYLGGLSVLLLDGLWWMTVGPLKGRGRVRREETFLQAHRLSIQSLGIVSLVVFFVGMILAFQMAYVLETLGFVEYVANITGVAMVREMGPLLVAIVLTGFFGAAVAAEIGTMVVSEEVTALEASALNPIRFLVVPRLLAAMLMLPVVTLLATYVGILGGFSVAYFILDIEGATFLRRTVESLRYKDVATGLIKAEAFGVLIALIACHEGLRVSGGAQGVGKATTNSVVRSIIAIIICDLIFTAVFYFFL